MFKNINLAILLLMGVSLGLAPLYLTDQATAGAQIERITVAEARDAVSQDGALMVCSYADNRCQSMLFQGAILRSELVARVSSLDKNRAIIFYCS
jgi:hypothetical protein